jgi:DNA-binding cell septation regulator SpoVG
VEVTEVRLRKVENSGRLLAVGSITLDGVFVIHEVRVVDTDRGKLVAMPNRLYFDNCVKCSERYGVSDAYCRRCGAELGDPTERMTRRGLHQDVCHPTVKSLRDEIDQAVLAELERLP